MKNMIRFLLFMCSIGILISCSNEQSARNGIELRQLSNDEPNDVEGYQKLNQLLTKPNDVLLTGFAKHRLIPIYKVNYTKRDNKPYIGTTRFYRTYYDNYYNEETTTSFNHYMPGIEAITGYNMLNISYYNTEKKERRAFFDEPVLINTVYYPSFKQDSLNGKQIQREYYLVSTYDEDTNQDSVINKQDLRRFYSFDLEGMRQDTLIPRNYSVLSSKYDPANDMMIVFGQLDENSNGQCETNEPIHVFGINLQAPKEGKRMY